MPRPHGETAQAYAQRRAFEASKEDFRYIPGPPIELPILCNCGSWRYPHLLSAHNRLRGDWEWPSYQKRESREAHLTEWDTSAR